ncbi:SAM-dependent methyltransferase, partial [Streptomyces sp. MS19]
ASLTPDGATWRVGESGPVHLWSRVEDVLDAYDAAGAPGAADFTLTIDGDGQRLHHPGMPRLALPAV